MEHKNILKFIPSGFLPMETQVAGHKFTDSGNTIGLLKHEDGYVLKSIVQSKKQLGGKEIKFYKLVMDPNNGKFHEIKHFVPDFLGTVNLNVKGLDVNFMKFRDVTLGLRKPCIMDIKIGPQTWEPEAPEWKKEAEERKYVASRKAFGFCIPGYQVYKISTNELIKRGKEFGKLLTEETLPKALLEFFNFDSGRSFLLQKYFEAQLTKILEWFLTQKLVHIYASSILLLYDAEELKTAEELLDVKTVNWRRVYMIDFAHVHPANNVLDENYIFGLKNLIKLIHALSES